MSFDLARPNQGPVPKNTTEPRPSQGGGIDAVPSSPPAQAASSQPAAPRTPETRATSFGTSSEPDLVSPKGVKLMAGAYGLAFGFLMLYVMWLWRRQGDVNKRLSDLEKEIDKAAAKADNP
jgi:hypothetical protein